MVGGTIVTIIGQNLGVTSTDIVSVIIGNNVPCTVMSYQAGRRYIYIELCYNGHILQCVFDQNSEASSLAVVQINNNRDVHIILSAE